MSRAGQVRTRRSVLALGVGAVGLVALPAPARADVVTVGRLSFTVPAEVRAAAPDPALGYGWQWHGRSGAGPVPPTVVLARADLPAGDAGEVLGLLLAGSAAGLLAGLQVDGRRRRAMPGGGDQSRYALRYAVRRDLAYHGQLLVAARPAAPGALLVVLGDDQLTAGTVDAVLESARWLS